MIWVDSRGQGFDVFKLLIAAVVASAILLILLQVIQGITGIGGQKPNDYAGNAVKTLKDHPGDQQTIKKVTFQENDSLTSKTIAEKSEGLSPSQVCVLVSESAPNKDKFSTNEGRIVTYNGKSAQTTKLLVACDRADEIEKTLGDDYGFLDRYKFSLDDCEGKGEISETSNFCVVAVISDS